MSRWLLRCAVCIGSHTLIHSILFFPLYRIQLHAVSAWIFLFQLASWFHLVFRRWAVLIMLWYECGLLFDLHLRWCSLNDLFSALDLIKDIRCTVDAELWLKAIGTDARSVRVVPVLLHTSIFGTDLRSRLLQHAVGRLIGCRSRLQRIAQVDIWIKSGRLATDYNTWSINVLRVFLRMVSCTVFFPLASALIILSVVCIRAWHKRLVLIIRENTFSSDWKRYHWAFLVGQRALWLHNWYNGSCWWSCAVLGVATYSSLAAILMVGVRVHRRAKA